MAKTKTATKSATVSEIVDRIQALTPDQQQQVTRLLDKLQSQPATAPTGQSLQDRLREIGLLAPTTGLTMEPVSERTTRRGRARSTRSLQKASAEFTPIHIEGEPLSQTLINDRR